MSELRNPASVNGAMTLITSSRIGFYDIFSSSFFFEVANSESSSYSI
jgi:hypothetical protein